jgi:hypothetical protein
MATSLHLCVIGASAFSQNRVLPNLGKTAGVDVLAVANRSRQSREAVAERFANSWCNFTEQRRLRSGCGRQYV